MLFGGTTYGSVPYASVSVVVRVAPELAAFLTTEDDVFITTEDGVFIVLTLQASAEASKIFTVLPRTVEFTALPRTVKLTVLPRTIKFIVGG